MVIFAGKVLQEEMFNREKDRHIPLQVAVTENGYMEGSVWLKFLEFFVANVHARRPLLFVLDGFDSHLTLEAIEYARLHQIILFALPPHTTHKTQPCDVGIF